MNITIQEIKSGKVIVKMRNAPSNPFSLGEVIRVCCTEEEEIEWRIVSKQKKVMIMDEDYNASHKGVWVLYEAERVRYE